LPSAIPPHLDPPIRVSLTLGQIPSQVAGMRGKWAGVVFFTALGTSAALAQDPQAMLDAAIRQHLQQQQPRQELRRLDLEEALLARRLSNAELWEALRRSCPNAGDPCPSALLTEATRRGWVSPAGPPAIECHSFSDGLGGGVTRCD
jgi:hypothetical protein